MGTEIRRIWVTERTVCKALAVADGLSCLKQPKRNSHHKVAVFFFIEFVVEPTTEGPKGKPTTAAGGRRREEDFRGQNATASGGRTKEHCCRKKYRVLQGDLSTKQGDNISDRTSSVGCKRM